MIRALDKASFVIRKALVMDVAAQVYVTVQMELLPLGTALTFNLESSCLNVADIALGLDPAALSPQED